MDEMDAKRIQAQDEALLRMLAYSRAVMGMPGGPGEGHNVSFALAALDRRVSALESQTAPKDQVSETCRSSQYANEALYCCQLRHGHAGPHESAQYVPNWWVSWT